MMALSADDQLAAVFGKATVSQGGVMPRIAPELEVVAKRSKKRKAKAADKVSKKADKKKAKANKEAKANKKVKA